MISKLTGNWLKTEYWGHMQFWVMEEPRLIFLSLAVWSNISVFSYFINKKNVFTNCLLGYTVTSGKNFTSVDDGNSTGDKGRWSTIFFILIFFSDNKKKENSNEKPGKKKVNIIKKFFLLSCLYVGSVPIFLEAALSLDISALSLSSDILWVLLLNQIHDQKFFKQRRASHPWHCEG